ncbi:MAG TPA: SHOCT domain-containing protein [Burkholderiales bacterium]|nr:SHOCT domain-containing protein [Burkholderiales bacterium]
MRQYIGNRAAAGLVLALASPALALAQAAQGAPYVWRDWGPWHMWGGWGFWWVFPLLMMLFVALCVFFMGRMLWGHGHSAGDNAGSALQILSERFARGEISREEFEDKRSVLVRRT